MVESTRANSKMDYLVVKESTNLMMEKNMKENGKMI